MMGVKIGSELDGRVGAKENEKNRPVAPSSADRHRACQIGLYLNL